MANTFNIQDTPAAIAPSQITGMTAFWRAAILTTPEASTFLIANATPELAGQPFGFNATVDTAATPNLETTNGLITNASA